MGRKISFKNICDALRDLIPFALFQKREKHALRSVTFSKIAGLAPNGTKSRKAANIKHAFLVILIVLTCLRKQFFQKFQAKQLLSAI